MEKIKKTSELSISFILQQVNLDRFLFLLDFDSQYPAAKSLRDSICPKIEKGSVFTKDMDDEIFTRFLGNFL